MPYRIDIDRPSPETLDRLVALGALDIEPVGDGLAAIIPDAVTPSMVARALGLSHVRVSAAISRDHGSVWLLRPQPVRAGSLLITSEDAALPDTLVLADSQAFGSGHHPTTILCIEALQEAIGIAVPGSLLDVGTGSGVLVLAALKMGVPRAVGVDVDADVLAIAAGNARRNSLANRLELVHGGPGAVNGVWPLVVANVLAAPLIEMAPVLVQRVASHGRLILSGIAASLEGEVVRTYRRSGMRCIRSDTRAGWVLLVLQASW